MRELLRSGSRAVTLRPIDHLMLPMLVAFAAQAVSSIYLHAIPLFGRLISSVDCRFLA